MGSLKCVIAVWCLANPKPLHIFLQKVFTLFSRVAASKALAAILKEVPIWSENFDPEPGTADAAVKRESDGDDAVDVADGDVVDLDLSSLTWESVEKFGHANQVSVEEPVRLFLPDRLEFSKAPEVRSFG